jgi:exonuclease III
MNKLTFLIALLIFISEFAIGQSDRRTDKSKLVVSTFNTYFMWDGVEPEEGRVNFPYKGDSIAAGEHMEDIAFVIKSVNPDILNLVEVEGLNALNRLNNKYLQGMGYKAYLIQGMDSYTGQDVGLLTRIDPEENIIQRYPEPGLSNGFKKSVSKNYYAKFDINGAKIAIVGLHFLAIPSNPKNINPRQAQADAIRQISEELDTNGYSLIVLGDFNDYDGELCCLDVNDNVPITTVLRDIKRLSNLTNSDDLINVHQVIDKNYRYTAHWDKNKNDFVDNISEFSSIDHILIAPELKQFIDTVHIFQQYNPVNLSDHFPITVEFDMNNVEAAPVRVKIFSLVPNPAGEERQNEKITLQNLSDEVITIAGWKFRDNANNIWTINSTINPNSKVEIMRNGQEMSLNNSGDTIELIDKNGIVIQSITYSQAEEEEVIYIKKY